MKKQYLNILALLLIAVLFGVTSCKKSSDETTVTPTLSVTPANQNVASSAGTANFAVTSNQSWKVVSDQAWCIVTSGGVGNGTVIANYTENLTPNQRIANITITVTGLTPKVVTITQGSMNSVTPLNQDVPATPAGTVDFTVSASVAWTAVSDQSWCTVTAGGTGNGTITATYSANTTTAQRVANITVTITGISPIMITVTQAGGSNVIQVSGEISGNVNWTPDHQYLLLGFVYVIDGAVLTIEPGTIIKGDKPTMGSLIVERGGKMIANGTLANPIIFTSNAPAGFRNRGDWGGIILCGKAPVNSTDPQVEGGPRSHYGGTVPGDNSGSMQYVRIEFAGYPFQPDKEINGLTFCGVGSATVIDYIMVSYSNDDSYEWFGGTVNCKHLIAYRGLDDDFDTDNGFSGMVQYLWSIRDKNIADGSGSNGFESDNDANGSTNTPVTHPIFSNVTVVGPRKDATVTNISANFKRSMHLRRNTALCVYNSVFVGYPEGLLLDGTLAQTNAFSNLMQIRNVVISSCTDNTKYFEVQSGSTATADSVAHWFLNPSYNNDTIRNSAALMLTDAFNLDTPNAMPLAGSPVLGAADFSNANLQNSFFTNETFIGAFGSTNWTSGWANWDCQNTPYNSK